MASPKDKLKSPSNGSSAVNLQMPAAQVRVRVPDIKIPEIKIPESNVSVDTQAFAQALEGIAVVLQQVTQQHNMILRELAESRNLIAQLAEKSVNVQVDAPKVTMPARPREFDVALVEDEDGIVGFKVRANLPN